MKPGEYIGADGRTYRWHRGSTYYQLCRHDGGTGAPIQHADWPAAKAALDALIEEEGGEWVEWETTEGYHYRATTNGDIVQRNYREEEGRWERASAPVEGAYRKGRSVALEECGETIRHLETELGISDTASQCAQDRAYASEKRYRELAERVQELVEAIEEVGGFAYPSIPEWHRVCDLARKVKL